MYIHIGTPLLDKGVYPRGEVLAGRLLGRSFINIFLKSLEGARQATFFILFCGILLKLLLCF